MTEIKKEAKTETLAPKDCVWKLPESCTLCYDGSYLQKRFAWHLCDSLTAAFAHMKVTVSPEKPADTEKAYILLCMDETMKNGDFAFKKQEDNGLMLSAGDYYGFTGGARALAASLSKHGYALVDGHRIARGNYTEYLSKDEQATAYAYRNSSDHRVMFYNVLWNDVCPEERDILNAQAVGAYLPDVLGMQEVNKSRRGNTSDGKGGLIALLAEMNYAEVVDSCVKNLYETNEYMPGTDSGATTGEIALANTKNYTDAFNQAYAERISGQALQGYGTEGGTKVTVDGETFYTFFNCSPLFYNTKTTKCLDAGYYWYKNQWDKRTCTDCELCKTGKHIYKDSHHPNSNTDAASKAATWGVFESLNTGERYIVISTHMCTRSNYVKHLQAKELITFINDLIKTYDHPVILGGDYNGNYSQPNYIYFTETAGYTDVERSGHASIHTTDHIRAHHPYPVAHEERGYVSEDKTRASVIYEPHISVDHILLGNGAADRFDITVYGVVVDEMTLAGSDHFPIYMDFSIN